VPHRIERRHHQRANGAARFVFHAESMAIMVNVGYNFFKM